MYYDHGSREELRWRTLESWEGRLHLSQYDRLTGSPNSTLASGGDGGSRHKDAIADRSR